MKQGLSRIARAAVAGFTLVLSAHAAHAAGLTFPDRNRQAVVDAANIIPVDAEAALNARIIAWDRATGHQLAVATVPSLQGTDIATYGYQLGRTWGLGRKGIDDGAILLLAPNERKVRIEVGRGLEPVLTDALTSQIIHETIVPKLKSGDAAGALTDGATSIMAAVPADAGDLANAPPPSGGVGWISAVIGLALAILTALFVWWRRHWRKAESRIAEARTAVQAPLRSRQPSAAPSSSMPFRNAPSGVGPYRRHGSPNVVAPVVVSASALTNKPTPSPAPAPAPTPTPSPTYDSSPSYSSSSYDFGSSSSSDSSSSGFDSGGGSFSGGGSDSSY